MFTGDQYVAMYNYKARTQEEISVKKGDKLMLLKKYVVKVRFY